MIKACTPEETVEAGYSFASNLKKGDLVLLFGVLGAGKTTFIRGVAQRLAPDAKVSSPSFNLLRIYNMPSGEHLYHLDLYRVFSVKELWDIRIEEFLEDGVVLVEWPGRFPDLLSLPHWKVIFKVLEDDCRWISFTKCS